MQLHWSDTPLALICQIKQINGLWCSLILVKHQLNKVVEGIISDYSHPISSSDFPKWKTSWMTLVTQNSPTSFSETRRLILDNKIRLKIVTNQ